MEDDTPLDDILEEMYVGLFVHTPFNWDNLYEKPEGFLSDYLLGDAFSAAKLVEQNILIFFDG